MTSPQARDAGVGTNTDKELWRERDGDYYSDSVFVTEGNGIGMNCGGRVVVKPVRDWIDLAWPANPARDAVSDAEARDDALASFTDYFVRNYPGPETIIGNPLWHAPKIFRAAEYALAASRVRPAGAGADEQLKLALLERDEARRGWQQMSDLAIRDAASLAKAVEVLRQIAAREDDITVEIHGLIADFLNTIGTGT